MTTDLSLIRQRVLVSLKWPIIHGVGTAPVPEIDCDPWDRRHLLWFPPGDTYIEELEYLHELAHAWLGETVHHLVGSAMFHRDVPDEAFQPLAQPLICAADWFAEEVLHGWCPEAVGSDVTEDLACARGLSEHLPAPKAGLMYLYGLILAQARHFGIPDAPEHSPFDPVADILLSVPPDRPSLAAMESLVNRLAALTTDLRVRAVDEDGVDVWDLWREPAR